jgi:hypothetical protein
MNSLLSWIALAILILSCGGLLLARQRQWRVAWLFLLYIPFTLLLNQSWPLSMALLRLITGWIVTTSIAIALQSGRGLQERDHPFGPDTSFFYIQGLALLVVIGIGATRAFSILITPPAPSLIGSIVLLGSGIFLFGFNTATFPYLSGILVFVNGFELLYASVESSSFLLFLLTALNLLAGLAISHHLASPVAKGDEP